MSSLELPIKTERLVLRTHEPADAVALQRIYGQPEVARLLLDEPWTPSDAEEKVAARLARTGLDTEEHALALVIEADSVVLGDVALWATDAERGVAEIGWVLDPAAGGRGYAAEAAGAVLRLGFRTYGLHRVTAQMDARNTASARLAERLGMRREAHLRQDWWSKGEWTDTVIYGMLADDPGARA
ncbi:GNAT family N-acetyltransferase [Nocardia puris]|uniref:Aminoglycoside 6'-N-acetyltransferase n=1 Tax=Nocardia puris TaxID=208602 RepID=A0A366DQK6_9NOCA|nr:GNAT family protein [Nocardia puris]MBF6213583.1 GNAT family N-acetyltransferase [Nocardia puris]MBF6365487.1 GNAT family N-acetyltransferase [Nocardia puris]MBF6459953.1 GNAT family N-acetyltransferase [Nocardia puris]RBO91564.1 aminoglycoside 6'-N-acetyltransferase [Nocardia puris]